MNEWSHDVYQGDIDVKDVDFLNLLISLGTMELGPEFSLSYETLNKIADDLIVGKCKFR